MDQPPTLYTIGHSNHPQEVLFTALEIAGVKTLVDVRSKPYSRYNPQFNKDTLIEDAHGFGISYFWKPELGGMNEPTMTTVELLEQLAENYKDGGIMSPVCLMCSEGDPRECHRFWWLTHYLALHHPEVCIDHLHPTKKLPSPLPFGTKAQEIYSDSGLEILRKKWLTNQPK